MRRVLHHRLVLLTAGALAVLATGASDGGGGKRYYWVELDNAFGLIKGGRHEDRRVRAGKIGEHKLYERTAPGARGEIEITKGGFGSLRTD